MPIYEYVCEECSARYEKLVRATAESNGRPKPAATFDGEAVACPKCGSKKATLQFSTFSTTANSSSVSAESCEAPVCMRTPRGCGCH